MSGICGLYYLDTRPVERETLSRMLDVLAHRGPDGAGLWYQRSVGLGHRMLRNTPESLQETLPKVHRSDLWTITADARIDNRGELIAQLALSDRPASNIPDSELILEAYIRWGDRCCDYLAGDFAFAIWDEREQRLFLARDRFGVKPLYYYCNSHLFAFATEIKALLQIPEVPRDLNPEKIADYLASLFEDTEITFYQNILRFPAAHQTQVTQSAIKKQPYWQLDVSKEISLRSDEEYAAALKEQFETAVQCRLRSAYPIGSTLSGGLDSSSIACMARDLLSSQNKPSLKTFSAIFEQVTECDESEYIQAVIDQGDIDPHFVKGDGGASPEENRISPLTDLEQMFWHQDEAFYAPNLFIHWAIYKKANSQNVRTVLDGFDGDTTISHGLPYITELAQQGHWRSLLKEIKGFSSNFNRPLAPLLWKYLWRPGLAPRSPKLIQRAANRLHRSLAPRPPISLSLNPDFAQSVNIHSRIQQLRSRLTQTHKSARHAHAQRLSWGVLPFTLEVADKAAAAHSIEPRFPFFDHRLVEFCLAIPPSQKIRYGWTRWVMRRAMKDVLPPKVQWRPGKSDLSPNLRHGLSQLDRNRIDYVMEDTAIIDPYVDMALLRRIYQRLIDGEPLSDRDVMSVWKPVTLALWLQQADIHSPLRSTNHRSDREISKSDKSALQAAL